MPGRNHPSDDDPNEPPIAQAPQSSFDMIFRAVNHPYRRQALHYLEYANEPQPVADIAVALIDTIEQLSYSDRQQHVIGLRHRHLPLLADAELIERTSRDLITATEMTPDAVQLLESARDLFD